MNHHFSFLLGLAFVVFTVSGPVIAKQDDFPEVTVDGLQRVPDSKLAVVYAEPGADLAQYKRVLLMDAYVAFKKNWERDQRRSSTHSLKVTSKDVENIKNNLSREFQTVFRKTLEDGGYEIVDEPGEDVLLIRPAIINLDVNAPDTPRAGRTTTYAQSAGEMTLYIELYDSVTGDLIAKALDRRADNQAFYTWTNSVTNKRAAEKILKGWASILLEALDEARQP
jgi:hypothetical protein